MMKSVTVKQTHYGYDFFTESGEKMTIDTASENPPRTADLELIFCAGRVRRWHGNLLMSDVDDRNDAHQGRVARILLALHPKPHLMLIAAALTHDDGELRTGDMNGDVKRANPQLREMVRKLEHQGQEEIWGCRPEPTLTANDKYWLKFADLLDSYMMMKLYRPKLERRPDWQRHKDSVRQFAEHHKMLDKVQGILDHGFEFFDMQDES